MSVVYDIFLREAVKLCLMYEYMFRKCVPIRICVPVNCVSTKGKGLIKTHWLLGKKGYSKPLPLLEGYVLL